MEEFCCNSQVLNGSDSHYEGCSSIFKQARLEKFQNTDCCSCHEIEWTFPSFQQTMESSLLRATKVLRHLAVKFDFRASLTHSLPPSPNIADIS